MSLKNNRRRALTALAALGLAAGLGGCDQNTLLEVQNPGAVNETDLNDPLVQQQVVNTVAADFQRVFDDLVFAGALLSGEGDNGHNFTQWIDIGLRRVEDSNSVLASDIYAPLHRARAGGDQLSERLKSVLGAKSSSDLGMARTLAYAGYGSALLGEYFCESPVADDQPALSSDELANRAIARFDEAIAVATAAKSAGASAASADSLINLSRVGAARAALFRGDRAKALAYAQQVPASFVFWANYSDAKGYQENRLYSATTGSSRSLGVGAKFRGLNDPRIRHNATAQSGHSPDAILYTPLQASSHSGWSALGTGTPFDKKTGIRLASGLEAQYIVAEAQGANATNIDFINSRRAVGNMAALDAGVSEAEFQAALREQRGRDFFLDSHRLGDVRRYIKQYDVDEFNKAGTPHPVAKWGNYEDATCFVPSLSERISNPAY